MDNTLTTTYRTVIVFAYEQDGEQREIVHDLTAFTPFTSESLKAELDFRLEGFDKAQNARVVSVVEYTCTPKRLI
jgi:hypothetical protein